MPSNRFLEYVKVDRAGRLSYVAIKSINDKCLVLAKKGVIVVVSQLTRCQMKNARYCFVGQALAYA